MSAEKSTSPRFSVEIVENGYILTTTVPDKGKTVGITAIHVYRGLSDLQCAIEQWIYAVRDIEA